MENKKRETDDKGKVTEGIEDEERNKNSACNIVGWRGVLSSNDRCKLLNRLGGRRFGHRKICWQQGSGRQGRSISTYHTGFYGFSGRPRTFSCFCLYSYFSFFLQAFAVCPSSFYLLFLLALSFIIACRCCWTKRIASQYKQKRRHSNTLQFLVVPCWNDILTDQQAVDRKSARTR